jgi:drug/metabolite transporter (DMT)-like permease
MHPPELAQATSSARRRSAVGVAYIAVSALCFGAMAVFARRATAAGVDTATLLLLRFGIAAAILWALFAVRPTRLPRGRGLAMLIGMGALGYAGQAFCYVAALDLASAGLVGLLLYLYPALVAILSWLFLRHPLRPIQGAAIAMALLGSLLTIGQPGAGTPLGILLAVLAALIYAGYILTGAHLPVDVPPMASTAVVTSAAAAVYGAVALGRGVRLPSGTEGWLAVVAIAVLCTVVAIALFLAGLERLGPVRASIYSTLEPAFTLLLAALFLGEPLSAARLGGGALIMGAVLLLARADARAEAAPTAAVAGAGAASTPGGSPAQGGRP